MLFIRQVKTQNLKPGMVIDRWSIENDSFTIKSVVQFERPGYRHPGVRLVMKSGRTLNLVADLKLSVFKATP